MATGKLIVVGKNNRSTGKSRAVKLLEKAKKAEALKETVAVKTIHGVIYKTQK